MRLSFVWMMVSDGWVEINFFIYGKYYIKSKNLVVIMAILTRSEFATINDITTINRILNEMRLQEMYRVIGGTKKGNTIFLSHSHKDKDFVLSAKAFLGNFDVDVYVDWADETMPENTSGATAEKIKNKINRCDKFVLLATNNAIVSKWCNWELGIGDTLKLPNNKLAIFPLAEDDGTWKGNEYLQIYPRIEKIDGNYCVRYPDKKIQTVAMWLRGERPYGRY